MRAFRIGVAGPVGGVETALVDCLSRELSSRATGPEVLAWLEQHLAAPESRDLIDAHAPPAAHEHAALQHHTHGDHHH